MKVLRSAAGEDPVVVEGVFPASPARLFRAWTDPDEFVRWFGAHGDAQTAVTFDLKVGGRWRYDMLIDGVRSHFEGEYTIVAPGETLAFTWRHVSEKPDGGETHSPLSTVTVTFHPDGAATRMRLTHVGLSAGGLRGVGAGWERSFNALAECLPA